MHTRRLISFVMCTAAIMAATGCSEPVHHGLDEAGANQMIVALERHGISASKERDAADETRWVVSVAPAETVDAWRALEAEGLPRPSLKSVEDIFPPTALIPTAAQERMLTQFATAQELRAGLFTIDGVVDAHVTLVLPKKSRVRLPNEERPKPRASVIVKLAHRAADAPPHALTPEQVRAMVSGGVEDLDPADVSVVLSAEQDPGPVRQPAYRQVGFISVAPASALYVKLLIGAMVLVIITLGAALAWALVLRPGGGRDA